MNEARTVIVGAGQAGLAVSRYLTEADHDHVLLERARVGERWRSERWDSLTLLSPNWLNGLPGAWPHDDPDAFLSRQGFVDYLDRYARSFAAPVREGAAVRSVERRRGWFRVATDAGDWRARNVVLATGWADVPTTPRLAASAPDGVVQLHSSEYRSPVGLPPGGVLVVGAGPSGAQIALELRRAGRPVLIAVGRHARMPRRLPGSRHLVLAGTDRQPRRSRSTSRPIRRPPPDAPSLVVSGVNSSSMLDLGVLGDHGVTVAGRLDRFDRGQAVFLDDLDATTGESHRRDAPGLLDRIDASIDTSSLRRQRAAADRFRRRSCSSRREASIWPKPGLDHRLGPRLRLVVTGSTSPRSEAMARSSSGAASRRCPVCTWSGLRFQVPAQVPTSSAASARTPSFLAGADRRLRPRRGPVQVPPTPRPRQLRAGAINDEARPWCPYRPRPPDRRRA